MKISSLWDKGITLDWLKSYLTNRKQFVSCNGADSIEQVLSYGVPQGSIIGPLLFVIYINDIPELDNLAHFILYADDANIIITATNILILMNCSVKQISC